MKLTIEPTTELTEINGVKCRVWNGVTDQGTECVAFVALTAVKFDDEKARAEFDAALRNVTAEVKKEFKPAVYDMRQVL